MEDTKHH